jgi:integrase/recombinase XerC
MLISATRPCALPAKGQDAHRAGRQPYPARGEKWLKQREPLVQAGGDALFVSRNGTRLTPRAIQYRCKTWALKLGLNSGVHPHVLRHSFASHVLQSSGDLRAVQEMLGHASISSTQIYTHLDFQYLAKVYDAAHPRAKKKS